MASYWALLEHQVNLVVPASVVRAGLVVPADQVAPVDRVDPAGQVGLVDQAGPADQAGPVDQAGPADWAQLVNLVGWVQGAIAPQVVVQRHHTVAHLTANYTCCSARRILSPLGS